MGIEIHAIVSGDVQGVGFRATARMVAQQLGIVGTVRNLPNGSVEIHAQGAEDKVNELFRLLQNHYFSRHVTEISHKQVPLSRSYVNFSIIY